MANLFESYYNESKDAEAIRKKDFVEKRVKRAFDAGIDNLQEKKLEAEMEIQGVQKGIANGAVGQIVRLSELALTIQEYIVQIAELEKNKKAFFS